MAIDPTLVTTALELPGYRSIVSSRHGATSRLTSAAPEADISYGEEHEWR
jgi:hypothetical protein